ncbi:SPP1 family predicted phage head-tail adaptor [Breoghania corrubedonensis]|uniref:SPP1 family predicted phage head-tail adaptor n=1 Tax=Breoghania corrubedonensis TaxID=665038 RepID=A0A2T5V1M4_9HYPH|nr:phage head closure protein [Breoghania corrubedonensis]PTW57657.1 SPP1 family predicted phage head-tail adaptor [Breoghania corrubedonensis]
MTRISDLATRLTVQRPVITDDGAGGAVTSFEPAGAIWGAVMVRGMAERFSDERLDGVVTHRIRLRAPSQVAGGWRLIKGARVFRVLAASDPDDRGRWLDLLAEEEGL